MFFLFISFLYTYRVKIVIQNILTMLVKSGLVKSRSEARQAVQQGGVSVEGEKITDIRASFTREQIGEGLLLKKGKKSFMKIVC